MERKSIVYFYVVKQKAAKEHFYTKPVFEIQKMNKRDIHIVAIGIPQWYWKEKTWSTGKLKKALNRYVQGEENTCYFYNKKTAATLHLVETEAPFFLMEEILVRAGAKEQLLYAGEKGAVFELLLQNFMARVNYFYVVTDTPEQFEEEATWLYEMYGLVTVFSDKPSAKEIPALVVDMRPSGKNGRPAVELAGLAPDTLYLDMCSDPVKRNWITKKRKDIRYLSPESLLNKWCKLDTIP